MDRYPSGVEFAPDDSIEDMLRLLDSPLLSSEVIQGNVTLAMIRPNLEDATLQEDWTDEIAADVIEQNIQGLGMITKFAVQFDREAIEAFYGGAPKEIQLGLKPERYTHYPNRWEEFADLMTSGPTTAILLHSPNGDAITLWRAQVGHYDIIANRDPANLRGRFGKDNYNNLVHGSDSPEAVLRELAILRSLIAKQ